MDNHYEELRRLDSLTRPAQGLSNLKMGVEEGKVKVHNLKTTLRQHEEKKGF